MAIGYIRHISTSLCCLDWVDSQTPEQKLDSRLPLRPLWRRDWTKGCDHGFVVLWFTPLLFYPHARCIPLPSLTPRNQTIDGQTPWECRHQFKWNHRLDFGLDFSDSDSVCRCFKLSNKTMVLEIPHKGSDHEKKSWIPAIKLNELQMQNN